MSAELVSASEPGGNNASVQGIKVGGGKPLHRFIRGQPKAIGIVILVLGTSFVMVSVLLFGEDAHDLFRAGVPPGCIVGTLFITCGILYVVTENNTTKKTVTVSLALSLVSIVISCWFVMLIVPFITHRYSEFINHEITFDENMTEILTPYWATYEIIGFSVEMVFLFYTFVGAIIIAVMSCLASSALRSTLTQAIVVMTTTPAETPVE